MGSYLMKILPVTIALFLALKFNKINVLLFLILSSIAIVLSGERSAAILLIYFLIIFIFFTKFLQLKFKLFVFLSFVLLISSSLYLFPEVKFRLMDSTLYQLGFIEPEQDYVEIQVNEKKYVAVVREEHFIPLKYYLMFNSSIKMFKDNIFLVRELKLLENYVKIQDIF